MNSNSLSSSFVIEELNKKLNDLSKDVRYLKKQLKDLQEDTTQIKNLLNQIANKLKYN